MREIRRILKEETAIPENIDKAMEDVLSGILIKKQMEKERKIQEIRKK